MEKATQAGVDKIADRIGLMRARLATVTSLRELEDRKEWRPLRDLLLDFQKTHTSMAEHMAESVAVLSDEAERLKLAKHQAIRDTYQAILDLVERPQQEVDKLKAHIEDLEAELKTKRDELAAFT